MAEQATLEFYKGFCGFSAGHFTIFSKNKRECLHGHNYSLEAAVTAAIHEPGMIFDYAYFKNKIQLLCNRLDRRFLLPENSPYLKIVEEDEYYYVSFDEETIPFLKKDVLLLPIVNTTLEALSQWFLQEIISNKKFIAGGKISALVIKVFNGPEQSAMARWEME